MYFILGRRRVICTRFSLFLFNSSFFVVLLGGEVEILNMHLIVPLL